MMSRSSTKRCRTLPRWMSWAALSFAFICPVGAASAAESDLKARIQSEYPRALAKLESKFSTVRGKGTSVLTTEKFGVAERPKPQRFEYARGPGLNLYKGYPIEAERARFAEIIHCTTNKTAFSLRRTKDSPLTIAGFGVNQGIQDLIFNNLDQVITAPFSVCGVAMSQILADPTFKILSASEVFRDDKPCLKFEYQFENPSLLLRSGWAIVRPEEDWVLVQTDNKFGTSGKNRIRSEVAYAEDRDTLGVPRPTRVSIEQPGMSRQFDIETIEPAKLNPRDFTLAAYGFPDLDAPPASNSGHSGLMFGSATFLMVVAAFLKYGASRIQR